MTTTARISSGMITRQPSVEFGGRNLRRTRSHSRVREDASATSLKISSDSGSLAQESLEGPLLPYDVATPSLADFPMPPRTQILPHPHAPPAPATGMRPAIHRSLDPTYYKEPNPDSKMLPNTMAKIAVAGYPGGPGRTIHGRTSTDLLSATGPVPIHFALGTPANPPPSTPGPRSRTATDPVVQNISPLTTSPGPAPSPQNLEVQSEGPGDRRSYTDIIAAIETPRYKKRLRSEFTIANYT